MATMVVGLLPGASPTVAQKLNNVALAGAQEANFLAAAPSITMPPRTTFLAPANESHFTNGQNVAIQVLVTNNPGRIAELEVFVEASRLLRVAGLETNGVHSVIWSNIPSGNFTLSAFGRDSNGVAVASESIVVHVSAGIPVLDQFSVEYDANLSIIHNALLAETFTAGVQGRLHRIELGLFVRNPQVYSRIRAQIVETTNGVPSSTVLADLTLDPVAPIYFPSNDVCLTAGLQYALVLSAISSNGSIDVFADNNTLYRSGHVYQRVGTNDWVAFTNYSFNFYSYVVPEAAPVVTLDSPRQGTRYLPGQEVGIEASATDSDGRVARVDFFLDGTLIGTRAEPPYRLLVPYLAPGAHSVSAEAFDDRCGQGESRTVTIQVGADTGQPQLSIADPFLLEGDSDTREAVFTVNLSTPLTEAVTVEYITRNMTAVAPPDYQSVTGRLVFPPSTTQRMIIVPVYADALLEANETFAVNLFNPSNAILAKSQGVCTIGDDEFAAGRLHHFAWSAIAPIQLAGRPIPVELRARDLFNNVSSNFTGPVRLTLGMQNPSGQGRLLGDQASTGNARFGPYTIGYSFKPSTNLLVTQLWLYSGTKVSLWSEGGTLLASATFLASPIGWKGQALLAPVPLLAGQTYRLGYFTPGAFDEHHWRTDGANSFGHGTLVHSLSSPGDAVPTNFEDERWPFVDLRYMIETVLPVVVQPQEIETLTGGRWLGTVTVASPGDQLYLRAEDLFGRLGISRVFSVQPAADLSLSLRAVSPTLIDPGQPFAYQLTVTNQGPSDVAAVRVTNEWSGPVTFVSAVNAACVSVDNRIVCELGGRLSSGQVSNATIAILPSGRGRFTNICSLASELPDIATDNNVSALTLLVNRRPSVEIVSPEDSARLAFAPVLPLTAEAMDADGSIQVVEFFDGTNRLGRLESRPYVWPWTNAPLGNHLLTARATDNDGTISESAPVNVEVVFVNAPPTFTPGPDQSVPEDTGLVRVPRWASNIFPGPEFEGSQSLVFAVFNDSPELFSIAPRLDVDGTLTFQPAPNAHGSAAVRIVLRDDGGTANGGSDSSMPHTLWIVVSPVNDPPVASGGALTTQEDVPVVVTLTAADVDGDPLVFRIVVAPGHGALIGGPTQWHYTPVPDFHGRDQFSFVANDGIVDSAAAEVSIEVVSSNDPPAAVFSIAPLYPHSWSASSEQLILSVNGSNAAVLLNGSGSRDADGDTLSYYWLVPAEALPFASGAVTNRLFGLGEHTVKLLVDDGVAMSTAEMTFAVVSPAEIVELIISEIQHRITAATSRRPLIASLKASIASFERGNVQAASNQLAAFQNKVRANLHRADPATAALLLQAVQDLLDAATR